MAGGSTTPEADDDRQCQHCGRWYSKRGVLSHEASCDMADVDVRVQPLEDDRAIMRADDVALEDDTDSPAVDFDEDVHANDDPTDETIAVVEDDGELTPATPSADDGEDVDEDATAATDGGPRSLPDYSSSTDDDVQEASADVDVDELESGPDPVATSDPSPSCPNCGAGADAIVDVDVVATALGIDDDHDVRDHDHACLSCSAIEDDAVRINAFDESEVTA